MRATVFVGKIVMVFDPRLWEKNGGDSKTDSFMREATILKVYEESPGQYTTYEGPTTPRTRTLVDVKFHHDGRISKGHFARGVEECPMAVKNDRP